MIFCYSGVYIIALCFIKLAQFQLCFLLIVTLLQLNRK